MTSKMQWEACPIHVGGQREDNALQLFGHTCSIVDARSTWGTELCICFGGVRQTSDGPGAEQHQALQEIVAMTADGESWFKPRVEGAQPPARAFHCAAVVAQQIYVFGGHVLTEEDNRRRRTFFNDLWLLNTENWRWQLIPMGSGEVPCKRDMATLTPLGPDALLLFGGRNEAGRTLGDAWLYDIEKRQWHQLRAGGVHPAPRKMHAAAYVNGRVLVFGGERDNGVLDDLWSLKLPVAPLAAWLPQHLVQQAAHSGTPLLVHGPGQGDDLCRWTQIRVRPSPPARFGHSLTVCGGGRLLLLFGGCLDQAGFLALTHSFVQCDETWVLDMASFSWHREYPSVLGSGLQDPSSPSPIPSPHTPHPHSPPQAGGSSPSQPAGPGQAPDGPKGPNERMCHSMCPLVDGRLLLLGGRRKEGICKDGWWLHLEPRPLPVPTSPIAQVAGTATVDGQAKAPSAPALLKSLFNPTAAAAAARPPHPVPSPLPPAPPTITVPASSISHSPSTHALSTASQHSSASNLLLQPTSDATSQQATPRQSGTGTTTTTTGMAATASAAMSKLTGKLLGSARGSSTSLQPPPGPQAPGGGVGAAVDGGEVGASWLPSVPDLPLAAGQLLDKLGALKAALPWQQQAQQQQQQQGWHQQQQYMQVPPQLQGQGGFEGQAGVAAAAAAGYGVGGGQGGSDHTSMISQQSMFASLDAAAAMAIQAAADAAEFERFRESVLHLPATPNPTTLPARTPPPQALPTTSPSPPSSLPVGPPPPDPANARAVRAALHQRGQLLSAQHPTGFPQEPISLARSHLSHLHPDEISLTDLSLVMQDYSLVLHASRHATPAGPGVPPPSDVNAVFAQLHAQAGLKCVHLLSYGNPIMSIRIGDMRALLEDYRQMCTAMQA